MDLATTLGRLEAAAEASRLRLLAVLADGEAAVNELTSVLGQSQPRVSRHLRLLTEAGLVENFRESRRVYYRLAPAATTGGIAAILAALLDGPDGNVATDRERMAALRRARAALVDPASRARGTGAWPEADLAEALDEALGSAPLGDLLDVGTGTGTVLRLLGRRARSATGLDTAPAMRELARARLHRTGLPHCSIRQGDAHALPFATGSFDIVVLDEVLCGSPRPTTVVAEAVRVLRAQGRLLVLDRILPAARRLPSDAGDPDEGALYENQLVTLLASTGLRPGRRQWLPGRSPDRAVFTFTVAGGGRAAGIARTGTHD